MACPACGNRLLERLGRLGTLLGFRCRVCGSTMAHRPRAAYRWLRQQLPSLPPQVRRAFGDYRILLTDVSEPLRNALDRYMTGLAQRSGVPWRVERISRPPGRHRAVLVNPRGQRVKVFHTPSRWRADQTAHVIPQQRKTC
jgi:hypothetical protein